MDDLDKLFNEFIKPSVKMGKHIEIMSENIKIRLIYNFDSIHSYYFNYLGNYYIFSSFDKYNDKFSVTNDFINYYIINNPKLQGIKSSSLTKRINIHNYERLLELFPEILSKHLSGLIKNDLSNYMIPEFIKVLGSDCKVIVIDNNVFLRIINHLFYIPPMPKLLPFYPL